MPAPLLLAAPLVIPFAEAIGLSVAVLGMAKIGDEVNKYIESNPEESIKILSTIIPGVGIGQIFANKEDSGDDEEVEVEEDTRSKKEIVLEEVRRGREGRGNFSSPDAEGPAVSITGNVKRGLRDAGKIKKDPDPNYDPSKKYQGYKRFLKKADGGAIGIEVLFEEKKPRKNFNIGGNVQRVTTPQPYDARASIMDYGAALDKVGAGTQSEKSKSLGQYAKNYFTGLGEAGLKKLNPSVRSLAASYGIGKPISKFNELGPEVGQALQGAIMQTLKDPRSSGISLKNIPVSSYTSYFKDRGVANTAGLYDTGYNSFGDQLKDMTAALAGDASAIARTTYGRFNVDIDPEARTGFLRDTYDFEKKMPGSTAYGINMALPQKFVNEILNSPEYQKTTGYKTPSQYPDYKTAALQSQYYKNNPSNLDSDLFRAAYARAVPDSGIKTRITNEGQVATDYGNYDPSRVYSAYMGNTGTSSSNPFFDQFKGSQYADMPSIMKAMYGDPGNLNPYYADGGRVGLFMGGSPLEGQALSIYNSMNAYGFDDQAIANALTEQGLYTAPGSGTPETPPPNIIGSQINQGGGGDGGGGITQLNPLNTRTNIASDINRNDRSSIDPLNEKIANQMTTQNPNLNKYTTEEIVSMNPGMFDIKTDKGFIGNTIDNFKTMSGNLVDKFSGLPGVEKGKSLIGNIMDNTIVGRLAAARNPLNPKASNYNSNLQGQMDFLEGATGSRITGTSGNLKTTDGLAMIGRDPNSGLAKYGPGSVLSGQNVVSGFGTNDYEEQLQNYIDKMIERRTKGVLTEFQDAKLDAAYAELKAEQERAATATATAAAIAKAAAIEKANRPYSGPTFYNSGNVNRDGGTGGAISQDFQNTTASIDNYSSDVLRAKGGMVGYKEGGLVTMFKEKK